MTLAFFVLTQYLRVTDGQTDRRMDRQTRCDRYYPRLHSVARVKTTAQVTQAINAIITITTIITWIFMLLTSFLGHCKNTLGSFDKCRLSAKKIPTLRPSQPTCAVSPPVSCHSTPTIAIIINYYLAWKLTHFTILLRVREEGWMDISGRQHTEMVDRPTSQCRM